MRKTLTALLEVLSMSSALFAKGKGDKTYLYLK